MIEIVVVVATTHISKIEAVVVFTVLEEHLPDFHLPDFHLPGVHKGSPLSVNRC